ncbi:MAG: ACP S-malonyltransferase, partial [Spirochaetaceae bacterium]|nr:ACP S-malonyltransferase [Spirochaetaceae bacterium]
MKKYAFLFPGQGAQFSGMAKDLWEQSAAAKDCLANLSKAMGEDLEALLWNTDEAELARSDRCQPAILAASLLAAVFLGERGVVPSAAAGFSLGEFPAMYMAGVLSLADTARVVRDRGKIMQRVCEAIASRSHAVGTAGVGTKPGMAAVIGLAPEIVEQIVGQCGDVYGANFNSSRQTVVSGTAAGLVKAVAAFKEAGARRVLSLAVAGPYHSPLMQEAADEFASVITRVDFHDPSIPFFSNVTGARAVSGAEIKRNAVLHLVRPVRWTAEEDALAALMALDS